MSQSEFGGDDDRFEFAAEDEPPSRAPSRLWRVLAVEDDEDFQRSTAFALHGANILGRPLELVQAYSMQQAAMILGAERDFAAILLDVVMESDDAGLRLVRAVREVLGMAEVRIVLLTGQPGVAPAETVIRDYDINDYCLKSDLSSRALLTILTTAIRGYAQLTTIATARRGLQLVIESSNRLTHEHTLEGYAAAALAEIAGLLRLPPEGIICVRAATASDDPALPDAAQHEPVVVGAAGRFQRWIRRPLAELDEPGIVALIRRSLAERRNVALNGETVLYLSERVAGHHFAAYLATERALDEVERELLHVFAANVAVGLHNTALFSRLDQTAYADPLLGIPNRAAFLRELDRRIDQTADCPDVVWLIDLDDFSGLNDAFGLEFGDSVLAAVCDRLRERLAPPAMFARVQSDFFAVLAPAETMRAEVLRALFDAPFRLGRAELQLSACVGEYPLALRPESGREVLRAGWRTLRMAKQNGPGSIARYAPEFDAASAERYALLQKLWAALQGDQLELHYQPQVELASGRLVGVEALLRWQFDGRSIPPDQFIPIAETSTYIHRLGDWVLEQACGAMRALDQAGLGDVVVSVNVSARQFDQPDLVQRFAKLFRDAGVEPRRAGLEITESAAMHSFGAVTHMLERFRGMGCSVSIDDFGTGLSSLGYLLKLPVDHLKIDRCFVDAVDTHPQHQFIARMVIDLGHRLGLQVVAEGVETAEQAAWLQANGCDIGQGWHFGRPAPFAALISAHAPH